MTHSQTLIDPKALAQHRLRFDPERGAFLHQDAVDEAKDRLALVNKEFTAPAIVTGFPAFWESAFPIYTVVKDHDALSLEVQAHDLVIHAMSLHASNDPLGQLIQCQRALKPDGLFLGVFLGGRTLFELRQAFAQAEIETTGGMSPRVMPMSDIKDVGALMQRAGFALPVADSVTYPVSYHSSVDLMKDVRAMGEANAQHARLKTFSRRSTFAAVKRIYAQEFTMQNKRVSATFELIWLTGWSPSADQPKALRPGSASVRLADALGSKENPL
ncbi:MAG: SAM-dependent methyltransferase [Paracoccaceae bacterium]